MHGPIRGLLLDIDDTLVDTRGAMLRAAAIAAAALWPQLTPADHEAFSQRFYNDPGRFFESYTRGSISFAVMRHDRYDEAVAGLSLPAAAYADFETAYLGAFATSWRLFADAARMIAVAQGCGVPLAFVTNSGDQQTAIKLRAAGLQDAGPAVTTDTLGVGKPDPRVFERAAELIGAAPDEVLVVGDTLRTDILGARAVGARAAWVQRPDLPAPRDSDWGTPVQDPQILVVTSLDAVSALLSPCRPA